MDIKMDQDSGWQKMRPAQAQEARRGQVEPSRESGAELDSATIASFLGEGGSAASGANATPMS